MMKERIAAICAALPSARTFADVGCDHGYMAQYMLENGLCERAYISDISEKSLQKAEQLLAPYIEAGKCVPVVADGLKGIPPCDLVLIAGMGGEEIVKILQNADMPPRFLLQPMKNTDKVRSFLLARGAKIDMDITFSEGKGARKYYDLLRGEREGGDRYNAFELRYGRDNLKRKSDAFLFKMREEREKMRSRLSSAMREESRNALLEKLYETEMIIDALEGTV